MTPLAKCPTCQHLVSVPDCDREARLQCPCCDAEFAASALVAVDAPHLRIVSSSSMDAASAADLLTVAKHSVSPSDVETDAPMPQVTETTAPRSLASSKARAKSRQGRSARIELLKIVLGGIAGIVIAQMILWWLPGDLRRDPFKVAPQLPAWLAFLTPAELRQPSRLQSLDNDSPEQGYISNDGDDDEQVNPASGPTTDPPTIDDSSVAAAQNSDSSASPGSPQTVGLRDPPSYSGGDLRKLLSDVRTQLEKYNTPGTETETRRNQLRTLYQSLCQIGEVVTFVDMDDQQIGRLMQACEALLARIANSPEQLELVGRAAATWIGYSSRITDGVAVAGEVIAIQPQDGLYVSTIRSQFRPDVTVQLVSRLNPVTDVRQSYRVGSRILALGSIIDEPQLEIHGFRGGSEPIVWRGLHIVLSPKAKPAAG